MKNPKAILIFFIVLSSASCKRIAIVQIQPIEPRISESVTSDSLILTIEAIDLSENMSRLSSKNDELLVFLYDLKDSSSLSKPVLNARFKLDERNLSKRIQFAREQVNERLLFVLIEQDSETPIEQIDPIIRVHYKEINQVFKTGNYIEIERYLGDEDILGMEIIPNLQESPFIEFDIKGIHKMDKYEYRIRIE